MILSQLVLTYRTFSRDPAGFGPSACQMMVPIKIKHFECEGSKPLGKAGGHLHVQDEMRQYDQCRDKRGQL